MKVVAFAASNSKQSINAQLVAYACSLLEEADIDILRINDYAMPIYSIDIEQETGIPAEARAFLEKLASADALIISFAEHNGLYTAAYKNLFDWASRADRKVYQNKPVLVMATSPGGRGGRSVLDLATRTLPHFGAEVVAELSVPMFYDNFNTELGRLTDAEIEAELKAKLALLPEAVAKAQDQRSDAT